MALPNDLVIGSRPFTRIPAGNNEGRFLDSSTSLNTPTLLIVRPKITRDGICSFVVQMSVSKDSPIPGAKDDNLSVQLSFRFDPRRFPQQEAIDYNGMLNEFLAQSGVYSKIFTGQV